MLSEIEVLNYNLLVALLGLFVMLGSVWFAVYRFKKEGAFKPRIQFDIECENIATQNNRRIIKVFFILENKGLTTQTIKEIRCKILGLPKNQPPERHKSHNHLVQYEKIENIENIISKNYGYLLFFPGVRQRLHIVTDIEDKYSSILVRSTIKYPYKIEEKVTHSAENSIAITS